MYFLKSYHPILKKAEGEGNLKPKASNIIQSRYAVKVLLRNFRKHRGKEII